MRDGATANTCQWIYANGVRCGNRTQGELCPMHKLKVDEAAPSAIGSFGAEEIREDGGKEE